MKLKFNLLYVVPFVLAMMAIPLFLFRNKSVNLIVNGKITSYKTRKISLKSFLSDINFPLDTFDSITPDASNLIKNSMDIEITQAIRFVLHAGNIESSLMSTSRLIGSILSEASIPYESTSTIIVNGVILSPSDLLDYSAFYDIQVLDNIDQPSSDVDTSIPQRLIVEIDDRLIEIVLSPSISNNFSLSITGIAPQQYNYFKISDEPKVLKFIRVNEEVVLEQYPIDFGTLYQPLSTIAIDEKATIQAGEFGLEAQRNRIRYENGVNISTTVEDSWLVRSALNRIIGYGTNISIQTLNTSDGLIEYYRSVVFYATSYSPARSGVDPSISWYGEVYCGGYTQYGYVAVDLDYVPCGTPLYVPGYGFAVAMDTGNFDGAWIDLGYEDDNWISWSRPVTVYFLTPVPPQDSIQWIIPPGSTPYLPGFTY